MADRSLTLAQATFLLNTEYGADGVSGDQMRRLVVRGAIPAKLVGNHYRLDEERLPEIAATIRRILQAGSPAAAPTASRPRRLSRSRPTA